PTATITRRKRLMASVFVKPLGDGGRQPSPEEPNDGPGARIIPLDAARRAARPRDGLHSHFFLAIVLVGYTVQKIYFRMRHRWAARLERDGLSWQLGPADEPAELWRLSRLAKRYRNETAILCAEIVGGGIPEAII